MQWGMFMLSTLFTITTPRGPCVIVPFSALTLSVRRQEGHPAYKKLGGNLLIWQFVGSFACLRAHVVTVIAIILSSNKVQNRDILVPANAVYLEWTPLKCTERHREREIVILSWQKAGVEPQFHCLLHQIHQINGASFVTCVGNCVNSLLWNCRSWRAT